MKKVKTRKRQYIEENPIEAKRDDGLIDSAASTASDFAGDFWNQVLGIKGSEQNQLPQSSGDLAEGQEVVLAKTGKKEQTQEAKDIEPGIEYTREILHGEKKIAQEVNQEISVKIQEILAELKQLIHSTQELKTQFKEIAVEPKIINPGKYHVSFFEWMVLIIRGARMKIEDSNQWLAVFKSKKAKKEYWSMFKKHGTSFGLSNERVVATQVG